VRNGYRMEQRGPTNTEDLVDPNGIAIARVNRNLLDVYAMIQPLADGLTRRDANDATELGKLLSEMAEEHYKSSTTCWQRFHNWRREFLGDPIWGWLAFIVTAVVAVLGWMS